MGQISTITCALPCFSPHEGEQTTCSVAFRTTGAAFAILAIAFGTLNLWNVPGINQLGSIAGWSSLSAGGVLALLSASIQSIQKSEIAPPVRSTPRPQEDLEIPAEIMTPRTWMGTPTIQVTDDPEISAAIMTPQTLIPAPTIQVTLTVSIPTSIAPRVPMCLREALNRVPHAPISRVKLDIRDVERVCTGPSVVYTSGPTVGIGMRLNVSYTNHDPAYVPNNDLPMALVRNGDSSQKPFSLFVVAYKRYIEDDFWIMVSKSKWIEHRGVCFDASYILGHAQFTLDGFDQDQDQIPLFQAIASQAELPHKYYHNLRWVLLRLLNGLPVTIREINNNKAYYSYNDPSPGSWEITLDQN